eukprot:8124088-Pyramimonas_sp.AAC.1
MSILKGQAPDVADADDPLALADDAALAVVPAVAPLPPPAVQPDFARLPVKKVLPDGREVLIHFGNQSH